MSQDGEIDRIDSIHIIKTALFISDNFQRNIASALNEIYIKQKFILLGPACSLETIYEFCVNTVRSAPFQIGTYLSLPQK